MQREKILTILLLLLSIIIIVGVCIIGIDAVVPLGSTYYILAKFKKNEKNE